MFGFRVTTSKGAAWRASYFYCRGTLFAVCGVDPGQCGLKPELFLGLPIGWYTSCAGLRMPRLWRVRLPLPRVPWRWCMATGYARPVVALYKLSSRFWHRMDGRYHYYRSGGKSYAK